MPNLLAHFVLLSYPLAVMALYARLPRAEATIWTILAAYLALPDKLAFDLPLLPAYDKFSAPVYAALIALLVLGPARGAARIGWVPASPVLRGLLALFMLAPIFTVFLNQDPYVIGDTVLKGQTPYDAASALYRQMAMALALLLARRACIDAAPARTVSIMIVGALIYTLPMLYEMRMSPILSRTVYGFTAFDFNMVIRGGGYRPTVFLRSGILVAIFIAMTLIFAIGLWRAERRPWLLVAAGWLALILFLSNSLGGLLLGVALGAVAIMLRPRGQMLVAGALATVVLLYPMMRSLDLVPTDLAVRAAAVVSDERSRSLAFRIINEDMLMAKANERPVFGWGMWGRSRVYDPESGEDVTVADGRWIITFGVLGWSGYIAEFGLLTAPIIMLGANAALRRRADPATTGLALGLLANLIDSIPNDSITPVTWAAAGLLIARLEALRRETGTAPEGSTLPQRGAASVAAGHRTGARIGRPPPRGA